MQIIEILQINAMFMKNCYRTFVHAPFRSCRRRHGALRLIVLMHKGS